MSPTAKDLLADALNLPDCDRAALAAWLIDSLDEEFDQDAQTAWSAEIERRLSELDDGTVTAVPWEEARKLILGTADGSSKS